MAEQEEIYSLFYEEWQEKISNSQLAMLSTVEDDKEVIIVTKSNLRTLLRTLGIEDVVKEADGANMLDFYENSQANFESFYKDLVKFIYQTSEQQADDTTEAPPDSDIEKIVHAYATPAERIIKLLVSLKQNLGSLSVEAAGFNPSQLERELNFAINKISERQIFSTELHEHREVLDQIRRRTSIF